MVRQEKLIKPINNASLEAVARSLLKPKLKVEIKPIPKKKSNTGNENK